MLVKKLTPEHESLGGESTLLSRQMKELKPDEQGFKD